MNGLYFYKLESPYPEDVTKNCKLTVNEIDSNFITLKDMDIKSARASEGDNTLILEKNNGDEIKVDLNPIVGDVAKDLDVNYDSVNGTITIVYNDNHIVIEGLVTQDNINGTIMTKVQSDSTLEGDGTVKEPLRISPVEQTSTFKAVDKLYDLTTSKNPCLPHPKHLKKGDRFITYENVSDYGFLYDFRGVKRIQEDLRGGWRVPTKQDWDGMLNAIEPCDEFKNHDSIMGNQVLGKFAGKFLKSKDKWDRNSVPCGVNEEPSTCALGTNDDFELNYDDILKDEKDLKSCCHPHPKPISADGIDAYGMGLVPSGYGDGCQLMDYFSKRGVYWTYTMSHVTDVYVKRFDYNKTGVIQLIESPQCLFSLRLVKDYDGTNHHEVETINGVSYPTVLMPSATSPSGFAIWTAVNVAFRNERYRPCEPNNGFDVTYHQSYFINEWDGFDFIRKEMKEGDSVVILNNYDGRYSVKYRIVNGVLVDESKMIYNDVIITITPKLDELISKITSLEFRADTIEDNITVHRVAITNLENGLAKEIEDRQYADANLSGKINDEIADRQDEDKRLEGMIEDESANREQVDTQIWEALNGEVANRVQGDSDLSIKIDTESEERKQVDADIITMINNIDQGHYEEIEKLQKGLELETSERKAADEELKNMIDNVEVECHKEIENLDEKLTQEITERKDGDEALQLALKNEAQERAKKDDELKQAIEEETKNRLADVAALAGAINKEIEDRKTADTELDNKIKAEEDARVEKDKEIDQAISAERQARQEGDKSLSEEIAAERKTRQDSDKLLWEAINGHSGSVEGAIKDLQDQIDAEENARINADNELKAAIKEEASYRQAGDDELLDAITEETERATNMEKHIQENVDTVAKNLNDEIGRAKDAEAKISKKLPIESGSYYDCGLGVLYIKQQGEDEGITIKLTSNYGTF